MDLFEVEGKALLKRYGIPTDAGILCSDIENITGVGFPCVAKAQFLSGKRGKAGGIRVVQKPQDLQNTLEELQVIEIDGNTPDAILLTPWLDIKKEHYLGLTIDRASRSIVLIYSTDGGVDIEEVAQKTPERIVRISIEKAEIKDAFAARLSGFGITDDIATQICSIAQKMYSMFVELDLTTLEINPLAQLQNGTLNAVDAKVVIDDNALPRQGDYTIIPRDRHVSGRERIAIESGFSYVEVDVHGNIGVIAGGAGIGMATVDSIKFHGAKPFNFLDLGGGVTKEKTFAATSLLLDTSQVEGIIINVFGGANDCAVMAEGICAALEQGAEKPIVVKSRGFNQEIGWKMYDETSVGQVRYGTTDAAVEKLLAQLKTRGSAV